MPSTPRPSSPHPPAPPSSPASRGRPSRATPPPAPSSRATWIAAAVTVAVMLLVPLGLLLLGRSLVPDMGKLGGLFARPPASAPPETPAPEPGAPRLRVRVVDGDGNGVANAAVRIVTARAPYELVAESKTDGRGVCAFPRARTDGVRVVASHDPEGVATSPELHDRGDGGTAEVELLVSSADAITGTVVTTADAGVRPVGDVVLSIEGMPWVLAGAASAVSGADGSFRLTTVPREAETLLANARGFRTARVSLRERAARPEGAPGTELAVRIELTAGPTIEGDVVDAEGNPTSARVVACEGEPDEARAQSSGAGTFSLPPSAVGCTVVATDDAHGASEGVTAVAGQRVTLRLRAGGTIEGVVVDERGAGVPSFTIGIESFSAARGQGRRTSRRRNIEDPGGVFRWELLAPGTYILTASTAGKAPTRSEPVDVTAGTITRGVRITLLAGGVVLGHVYDPQRAPLEGVTLTFDQVSSTVPSSARAQTDEKGAFRIEGAPAGPFTLRAEKEGFRLRFVSGLTVASGATLPVDVTLSAANEAGSLELGGIGATIDQNREGILLRGVFAGDPADRAGLKAGDLLLRIDGESTESMSLADVLQRLRGEAGTTVGITVKRASAETPPGPPTTIDVVAVRALVVH